jgi:hypothetical protein
MKLKFNKVFSTFVLAMVFFIFFYPFRFAQEREIEDSKVYSKEELSSLLEGRLVKVVNEDGTAYFQLETVSGEKEFVEMSFLQEDLRGSKLSKHLQTQLETVEDDEMLILSIETLDIDQEKVHYKTHQSLSSTQREQNKLLNFSFMPTPQYSPEDYLLLKGQISSSEYLKHHDSIFQNSHFKGKMIYQSPLSPFQVIASNKKEISTLEQNPFIVSIDLIPEIHGGNAMSVAFPTTGLDFTSYNMGLRGNGLKIGLIEYEGYPNQNEYSELRNTNIVYDFHQGQRKIGDSTFHASLIAAILSGQNGIVPDATLYATSVTNGRSFYEKVEWLVKNNVDVINFSGYVNSKADGNYGHVSKWIDHISSRYNITFVNSAGNSYDSPMYTSSLAYNAIVVGAINTKGTSTSSDDVMYTFSSHKETNGGPLKPDITAPGQIFIGENLKGIGTSISAPLVSAAVASIIEYNPMLKNYPEGIKAILSASAFRRTATDYGIYPSSPDYSDKEGSGVLNSRQAINWILRNNRYLVTEMDYSKNFIHNFTVNKNETYRVALTWNKQVNASSSNLGNIISDDPLIDLDLYVVDENGKIIARSVTSSNNVELVRFRAAQTGNYRIVVKPFRTILKTGRIGLAWW